MVEQVLNYCRRVIPSVSLMVADNNSAKARVRTLWACGRAQHSGLSGNVSVLRDLQVQEDQDGSNMTKAPHNKRQQLEDEVFQSANLKKQKTTSEKKTEEKEVHQTPFTAMDETAAMADLIVPDRHFLESWGDASPVRGCDDGTAAGDAAGSPLRLQASG